MLCVVMLFCVVREQREEKSLEPRVVVAAFSPEDKFRRDDACGSQSQAVCWISL